MQNIRGGELPEYKTHPICISAKFSVKINKSSQCNDTYAWWHTWIVSQMLTESMILIHYLPYIGKNPSSLQSATWWNKVLGFRCLWSFPFCISCFFHKPLVERCICTYLVWCMVCFPHSLAIFSLFPSIVSSLHAIMSLH